MTDLSNPEHWSRKVYFGGLFLLIFSLPLSKFGMSVAQFAILGAWLLSGDLLSKFRRFFECKIAVLLALIYLMHVVGVLWSTDMNYALKDLRIKLPLLALPVIMASWEPLSVKQFKWLLFALLGGTTIAALIGYFTWLGWTGVVVNDPRDLALFVSHIRLSLMICLCLAIAVWFIAVVHKHSFLMIAIALLQVGFLYLMEAMTGMIIVILLIVIMGVYRSFYLKNKYWRYLATITGAAMIIGMFAYVQYVNDSFQSKPHLPFKELPVYTASSNLYYHDTVSTAMENGHLVWIYISEKEMRKEWSARSALDFDGRDKKGQQLLVTQLRYLTSKGLTKDSAGMAQLSDAEIKAVEGGIANVYYFKGSKVFSRVHQLLWELKLYRKGAIPEGHSFTMRLIFWKTAVHIIQGVPLTGVGTGDLNMAYQDQYEKDQCQLSEKWRLRAHNQYLSIAVAFGIPGLLLFLWVLWATLRERMRQGDTLFFAFWLIVSISMLTEDTLESQAGVTFFTLFYCLFLFVNPQKRACNGIKAA